MITEDYCSPEVAKLLDKKGFREYCEAIYFILENGDYRWSKIDIPIRDCSTCKPAAILCPTHQMAMKWLREEKNLFIDISFINHYTKDEILHTGWCFAVFHLNNFDEPYYKDIEYSTYEQAVEAALKYSLENLI